MNRRTKKIVTIFFIIAIVICITNIGFAAEGSELVKAFDVNNAANGGTGVELIKKVIGPILNAVRIVATGVSIIMITYLGITYMMAAPSEKANVKNQLITFTIGAVVVVGTVNILKIIEEVVTGVFS